jgi:hypothetical protein
MKKINFLGLLCSFFLGFMFTGCDDSLDGGEGVKLISLQEYQDAGADVAAREWTENYDCSNFSTQFYQNCHKNGLPCRVRAGQSGGSGFSSVNHAWNSVKINGVWVNWEPQLNMVYNEHEQTKTPINDSWGNFVQEDIVRIIYENVGKYVPEYIINDYEIDTYWNANSPFYQYFTSISYCLSDDKDQNVQDLVSYLQSEIPANNSGGIFIDRDKHLFLFFRYNNKYYGIENLEAYDPVEGRSVRKEKSLKETISSDTEFTKLNINLALRD